jgi:predicted metalloprotease with PDZ domain
LVLDEEGAIVSFEKINKNTWRVFSKTKNIQIHYRVYAFERSVRTSFVDSRHAFISSAGTFMYIDEALAHPAYVYISLPDHWHKISTGLQKTDDGSFVAEDFDQLYDSPFELGNQDTWTFEVEGTLHEYAMVGRADYDKEQLTTDVSKIIREENKIWGSNPNDYYLFVTHHTSHTTGGLEHLNSTILATPRFNYSNTAAYKAYLGLVSHEYFHLWNVKRLRPKALGPFNYNEENYTTGLWMMEGFTSYYDNLVLRRCAIYNEVEYLEQLANDFNLVYNRPGYKLQSAAASSFDTWIKQYRPDENSHNTSISYYNKGAMLAAALDIHIIAVSKGQYRLDNVLREAYKKFYLIENRGFEEAEFQELAEQVTGVDLSEIFQAAHQSGELDYNKYFNAVGYELVDTEPTEKSLSLGIKTSSNDGRIFIKNIDRDSAAWFADLHVEDELIAIDGYRIDGNGKAMDYVFANKTVGDTVKMIVARDGLIEEVSAKLQYPEKHNYVIQRFNNASDEQKKLGDIWLSL